MKKTLLMLAMLVTAPFAIAQTVPPDYPAQQDRSLEAQIESVRLNYEDVKAKAEQKLAQEKEEKEERLDKQTEQRKDQEEILDAGEKADKMRLDVRSEKITDSQVEEAQRSIHKLLEENHLINEDIKGIEIDLRF